MLPYGFEKSLIQGSVGKTSERNHYGGTDWDGRIILR